MRFYEFKPISHIKPLTPAQARLKNLQTQADRSKKALKTEKESQKRQKQIAHGHETIRKAQQQMAKAVQQKRSF
jgi:hypothetical protein